MRKKALIGICMLLVCLTGWAQYPLELEGDKLVNGSLEIQAYLYAIDNPVPFGIYSTPGDYWFLGDICFDEDFVVIRYTHIGTRICRHEDDSGWGLPPGEWLEEVCYILYRPRPISFPSIRIHWNPEANTYLDVYQFKTHTGFTSLTVDADEDQMWLRQGTFEEIDGEYVVSEDDDCHVYLIEERTAESIFPLRRPTGRRLQSEDEGKERRRAIRRME